MNHLTKTSIYQAPLLVIGFDAFGGLAQNPSETLVRELAQEFGHRISTAILPTSYEDSLSRLDQLLADSRLAGFLMFGYSARSSGLRLERYAHNLNSATLRDNDGELGPTPRPDIAHRLTVLAPIDDLAEELRGSGIPVAVSEDAGGYVCNYAYYGALEVLRGRRRASCLFVHVPDWETHPARAKIRLGSSLLVERFLANLDEVSRGGRNL